MADRFASRQKLLGRALRCVGHDFQEPGSPTLDAMQEYEDEQLLVAAREFVDAYEGVKTHTGEERD